MHFTGPAGGALCLATALAIILATPSLAAEIEAPSAIEAVTVYPDGATVTRVASLGLPAGSSTIVFKGLPATLDPASLRVIGQGSASFAIGSVEARAVPGDAKPVIDTTLEGKITGLRDERDALAARLEAQEGKRSMIQNYAAASPEKLSPDAKPLDVSQWSGAWDAVGAALTKANEEIRGLKVKLRDIDGEIAALERARPNPIQAGGPKRDVSVTVEAGVAVEGALSLTYRVSGANWRPIYDARLDTGAKDGKPSLELIRRAQVTQRTGEDWSNVSLSVSTVRVARGTGAPDLPPVQMAFYEPLRLEAAVKGRGGTLSGSMEERDSRSRAVSNAEKRADVLDKAVAAPAPVAAVEQQAGVEAAAFQANFAVPGRVAIPQDGSPKTFRLGSRTIAPALAVKAVPVMDEAAYLEASFVNEDEAPLLPGEVAIHRDDTFVGRGRLGLVAPGDKVDLGFGSDDKVKVTRVPVRRRENEPGFFGSTKTDQREFKTTIKNLHAFPIKIAIIDRVPYSDNTAIVVETLSQTTPATEKIVDDKRGVMGWTYDYAPGEQREIKLAYRMKWPADREIAIDGRFPLQFLR